MAALMALAGEPSANGANGAAAAEPAAASAAEPAAAAAAEPAADGEPRKKRRRWSDAPAATATAPPALDVQEVAAEAMRRMNEQLVGPQPTTSASAVLQSLLKPLNPPAAPVSAGNVAATAQAAAAEAMRRMNEQLGGGGGGGAPLVVSNSGRPYQIDIDINDCPNKAALTKKSTQQEVEQATNVTILIRGRYRPPGDTSDDRPIHLHLEALEQDDLTRAEAMIREIMGPMPAEPAAGAPPAGGGMGLAPLGSAAGAPPPMPEKQEQLREALEVGLDPAAGYQVRGKLLGPKGSYLKHIQDQTGIHVQLAGKGSGNMMSDGVEQDVPLQMVLTGTNEVAMGVAKDLAESLIKAVKEDYERRNRPAPPPPMPPAVPPPGVPPPGYGAPPPAYGAPPPPYGYAPPPGYGYPPGYPPGYGHESRGWNSRPAPHMALHPSGHGRASRAEEPFPARPGPLQPWLRPFDTWASRAACLLFAPRYNAPPPMQYGAPPPYNPYAQTYPGYGAPPPSLALQHDQKAVLAAPYLATTGSTGCI